MMQNNRGNSPKKQNVSIPNSTQQRPQNKDDIDSRSNEEQDTKGGDITHNEKEKKSDRSKVKND